MLVPDDVTAARSDAWSVALRDHALDFEDRPCPTRPTPVVLDHAEADRIAAAAVRLHGLLERVIDRYRTSADLRRALFADYAPAEADLLAEVPYAPAVQLCRFDGAWTPQAGYRVVEANTACPGGVVRSGLLTRAWLASPLRAWLPPGAVPHDTPMVADPLYFGRALLGCARGMGVAAGRAAVVHLPSGYRNEVDQIVDQLRRLGLDAAGYDAGELSSNGGTARPGLIYHKLDPLELLADRLSGHRRAFHTGDACLVSSLPAQLVTEDKAVFAILTDPRHSTWLDAADRQLVAAMVPWTRLLAAGATTLPDGRTGDLLDYAVRDRRRLVLKPANLTRGQGVVHGLQRDDRAWRAALAAGLRGRYVLQERVAHPTCRIPVPGGAAATVYWGLDVFVVGGAPAGFHARACGDPTINIGRDGAALPVVVTRDPATGRPRRPDSVARGDRR